MWQCDHCLMTICGKDRVSNVIPCFDMPDHVYGCDRDDFECDNEVGSLICLSEKKFTHQAWNR